MRLRSYQDIMTPLYPQSLDEWKETRAELINNIRFSSSVNLLKTDTPLNPIVTGTAEYDGYTVENVIFSSLPGFYVCGNLYRPNDISRKYPCVLQPHGHWEHGRTDMNPLAELPKRYANFALRGMIAFAYDMVGYVDSAQIEHQYFRDEYEDYNYGNFSLQLLNSLKAVDFVSSLPYVDSQRIGCTGASGGGTQTYFLTAIDDRIKAAAPINMASHIFHGGCNCENTAHLRTDYCNVDYTMCISPRPLFMAAADGDWTVHSQEVEFPVIRHLYSLYDAEDKFECFYQHAPHCYNQPVRERVYDFFCRSFGIENPSYDEYDVYPDINAIKIGDIRDYVPAEGFITSNDELFDECRGIIECNLKKLSDEEKEKTAERVFHLNKSFETDIPYTVSGEKYGETVITLGSCPVSSDDMGIKYRHCYNVAEDTMRVNALISLIRSYDNPIVRAGGKSAAIAEISSQFAECRCDLTDTDYSDIKIPGIKLVRK